MLKHAVAILVVAVSLLTAVGAVAFAMGKEGYRETDIGVGTTGSLAKGVLDSKIA